MTSSTTLRGLRVVLYAVSALILVDQVTELAITALPARLSDMQWRFGLFGLFAGRATPFLLADGLVLATALIFEDSRLIRPWAILHLILALPLAVGLAVFGLDVVQLGRTVRTGAERGFAMAAVRAGVMGLFGLAYCVMAGLIVFRATRKGARRHAADSSEQSLLVVTKGRS
ncbi:MAG: hypothetical protein ABI647_15105 [Gemmatimonadota bacterium]